MGYDIYDQGYHLVRHVLNSIFGLIAILFIGLTAKLIGGWPCGLLAMIMAFLSPRFLGHSLMNPKDIPFATGYIMSLYFILKWACSYPKITFNTTLGLVLGIAVAIGVRVGGVILLPIFWMVALLKAAHIRIEKGSKSKSSIITLIKLTSIPSILGFALGLAFWPYGLIDPIRHIPEAISEFSEYFISIRLLFMGNMIYSSEIPFYYLPVWMLISSPLFIWLGLLFLILRFKAIRNNFQKLGIWLLIIGGTLPLVIAIAGGSSLYDGWRHFLFVFASFMPLFAVGLFHLIVSLRRVRLYTAGLVIVGLTFAEPFIFIARYPMYPYIYFNPVIGGINGAYGKFETDYWGLSVSKGLDWLAGQKLLPESASDSLHIITNLAYPLSTRLKKQYGGRVQVIQSEYRDRDKHKWDYGVFVSRFIPGEHLRQNLWPEKSRLVNTIYAGKTPLSVILHNEDDLCFQAFNRYQNGQYGAAIQILSQELRRYPDNEASWTTLGQALMQEGQYERAELAFQKALDLAPRDDMLNNHIAMNFMQQGKDQEGLNAYRRSLEINPKNAMTYYFMALYYRESNDIQRALELGMQCIRSDAHAKPCFSIVSDLHRRLGNIQQADHYRRLAEL